jgi:hypothetical protein
MLVGLQDDIGYFHKYYSNCVDQTLGLSRGQNNCIPKYIHNIMSQPRLQASAWVKNSLCYIDFK